MKRSARLIVKFFGIVFQLMDTETVFICNAVVLH